MKLDVKRHINYYVHFAKSGESGILIYSLKILFVKLLLCEKI
jgi:hypothetical protein